MNLNKLDDLLEVGRATVNNATNEPGVMARLTQYGMSNAYFMTGKHLLQVLEHYQGRRLSLQNERWALSQQINAGLKAVRDQLREHSRIARFALNDNPERLHSLQVDTISTRTWDCVAQATFFYQRLQQQNITLEKFGLSKKEIQQSLDAITALLQQKQQRTHRKGQAEHGTQQIQQAQAALRDWLVEFRGIARVAYRQQPQRLESFGMPVRSSVKGMPTSEAVEVVISESSEPLGGNVINS